MSTTPVRSSPTWLRAQVSAPVLLGVLVLLLAVFVPLVRPTPTLPRDLPPFRVEPSEVLSRVEPAPTTTGPVLTEIDRAFTALAAALDRRDTAVATQAQSAFATLVQTATAGDASERARLRARHRAMQLPLDRAADSPLAHLAARHGLAASTDPHMQASLHAWFDLRWEVMALPPAALHTDVPLTTLVRAVPEAEQRALASWALAASCDALLGRLEPQGTRATTTRDAGVCARVRHDFVDVAAHLDPAWGAKRAHAIVDVKLGLDLDAVAQVVTDPVARDALRADESQAFERAERTLIEYAVTHNDRHTQRELQGVTHAMGH